MWFELIYFSVSFDISLRILNHNHSSRFEVLFGWQWFRLSVVKEVECAKTLRLPVVQWLLRVSFAESAKHYNYCLPGKSHSILRLI